MLVYYSHTNIDGLYYCIYMVYMDIYVFVQIDVLPVDSYVIYIVQVIGCASSNYSHLISFPSSLIFTNTISHLYLQTNSITYLIFCFNCTVACIINKQKTKQIRSIDKLFSYKFHAKQ